MLGLLEHDARDILGIAPNFHFAVNLSAADIHSADLPDTLPQFCRKSGVTRGQLIVEATERSFVDADTARGALQRTQADGIQVAIDDFGTGYSNLGYLARLEVDLLKTDKLLVDEIGSNSASEVAERVVAMAKALNLRIVAEGLKHLSRLNDLCNSR